MARRANKKEKRKAKDLAKEAKKEARKLKKKELLNLLISRAQDVPEEDKVWLRCEKCGIKGHIKHKDELKIAKRKGCPKCHSHKIVIIASPK